MRHQLNKLEQMIKSPAHWPAWFADMQQDLKTVEQVSAALGVPPETLWTLGPRMNVSNPQRCQVIHELHRRGWSVGRIARIGRTNERSVERALAYCKNRTDTNGANR